MRHADCIVIALPSADFSNSRICRFLFASSRNARDFEIFSKREVELVRLSLRSWLLVVDADFIFGLRLTVFRFRKSPSNMFLKKR